MSDNESGATFHLSLKVDDDSLMGLRLEAQQREISVEALLRDYMVLIVKENLFDDIDEIIEEMYDRLEQGDMLQ